MSGHRIRGQLARGFRLLYRRLPVKRGLPRAALALRAALRLDPVTDAAVQVELGAPLFAAELDLRDRIQYLMFMCGHHELDTERLIARTLGLGATFVDVGANIGYFSLLAAGLDPGARVFAFEPSPKNAAQLRRNVALNPCSHVVVEEMALSDRDGTRELVSSDPTGESGWGTLGPRQGKGQACWSVRTGTLDAMVRGRALPVPTFLKIDVEGHELAVLRGATATLAAPGRRQIVIEINEPCLAAQGTSGEEVDAFLRARGYAGHQIERGGGITRAARPDPARSERNFYYVKER